MIQNLHLLITENSIKNKTLLFKDIIKNINNFKR